MSSQSDHKNGMDLVGLKVGVCIKSLSGRVLYQNQYCQKVCGDHVQEICDAQEGCMKFRQNIDHSDEWADGIQVFKSKKLNENSEIFDLAFIKNDTKLVTLLQPLENQNEVIEKITLKYHLTKKEKQVLAFIMEQNTNIEIAQKLNITKATLKTHVNHLYQKVPLDILSLFRKKKSESVSEVNVSI